ncbi:Ca2+-binding RTX toxin-like protein [Sphingobium sp. OAS761]|uniref:calcium-binding protein n=1 Tax=Sphingobium sp. OAS761 TaxID=2817901 RepID=UPI00209E31D9|nr:calcium-binding protein [Sphingobium sp. OAS761]MCP1468680.1 Ca2+-binding RTX toxin-like protein [Sphingobium sp. OAS761]
MLIKPLGPAAPFSGPSPTFAILANGDYAFVWTGDYPSDSDGSDVGVRAQIFGADGTARGPAFWVNSTTEGYQVAWGVDALANGGFVVSWRGASPQDYYGETQYARIFDAAGKAVSPEIPLGDTFYYAEDSTILALPDGGFLSAWHEGDFGTTFHLQRHDADGNVVAQNDYFVGDYHFTSIPEVTLLSDGRFVVTWSDLLLLYDFRSEMIAGQIFDATLKPVGETFTITGDERAALPHSVATDDGGFLAVWDEGIIARGRLFDAQGVAIGYDFVIARDNPVGLSVEALDWGYLVQWRTAGTQAGQPSWTTSLLMLDSAGQPVADAVVTAGTGRYEMLADGSLAYFSEGTRQYFALPVAGTAGADTLIADDSGQVLLGLGGDDTLTGGDGDDSLHGGDGADRMAGGIGDDSYYVDDGDIVTERPGEGTDTVYAVYGGTLSDNVENLVFLGGEVSPGPGSGRGNASDNVLDASLAEPIPFPRQAPVIYLYGEGGNDTLIGSDRNLDVLDGGTGADIMMGGAGADTYYVDNAGDRVIEGNSDDSARYYTTVYSDGRVEKTYYTVAGDLVIATIDYSLPAFVERLSLGGSGGLNGTGNKWANILTGNDAANRLDGAGGADAIYGQGGNDLLIGGAGDDELYGGTGDDRLSPGAGNNLVDGGAGSDTLVMAGKAASYGFIANATTGVLIGAEGMVRFTNVEAVQFSDGTMAVADLSASLGGFDALRYVAGQKDLIAGIGPDAAAATSHYLNHGIDEGRDVTRFAPLQYVAGHADLRAGIGADAAAGTRHYLQYGAAEGRSDARFDGLQYAASYGDLSAVFRTDAEAAARHYIQYGAKEGRSADAFDGLRYVASNPDLILALGDDDDAAAAHYIQFGRGEHRATASFDALAYAAANPDLARAFGSDVAKLTEHYVDYGYFEHRSTGFAPAPEPVVAG